MRLLHRDKDDKLHLTQFTGTNIPVYAILSHTWGPDGEDVTFRDLETGGAERKVVGFRKIDFCAKQAANHGLQHFWVDSCCIDKSSSAELTEAINSMFRWYKSAARCYVFLADVSTPDDAAIDTLPEQAWKTEFQRSRWFTRGWTLQELIAPASVEFFSVGGQWLGNKITLEAELQSITGIGTEALRGKDLSTFSIEERMGWASKRNTTREEDQAYCLLGIFDIYMPLIYGEGSRAYRRLQKKIEKSRNIHEQSNQNQPLNTEGSALDLKNRSTARESFLSSLFYPEHAARRENVKPSWENTFEWIFEEDDGKPRQWSNFDKWLQDSSSVYWICGKAGSGKSTLMSHILHKPQFRESLGIWNSGERVHVLSFFFWRAGSQLQKSVVGMLRSLLYQLLEEIPETAFILAAKARLNVSRLPLWTERNLANLLATALEIAAGQKFCLMIDGLDEFEGDTDELLDLILGLESLPNVKCCLSSRPETEFIARLSSFSQLQLQDLNRADIERFVNDKLSTYRQGGGSPTRRRGLVHDIVDKSEGVFLWAALVTGSVVQGMRAGDDDDMVRKRVESTPSQMESLFAHMLASVEPIHRESLAFYIEIVRSGRDEFGAVWPTSVALITASTIPEDLTNYREFSAKCKRTEKQILAQSKGLLELSDELRLVYPPQLLWSIPQNTSRTDSGPSTASTWRSRKAIAMSRELITNDSQARDPSHLHFAMYDNKFVTFVHRSAYEFLFSSACEEALRKFSPTPRKKIQYSLLTAHLKLLVAAPSKDIHLMLNDDGVSGRLHRALLSIKLYSDLSPNESAYRLLDELQDYYQAIQLRELELVPEDIAGNTKESCYQVYAHEHQILTQVGFWNTCIQVGASDYVRYHLSAIFELDCRGVALAILCDTCSVFLPLFVKTDERGAAEVGALLRDMLSELKRHNKDSTQVQSDRGLCFGEVELNSRGLRTIAEYDISWSAEEKARPFHDDRIVCLIARAFIQWTLAWNCPPNIVHLNPDASSHELDTIEDITELFKVILEPWNVYLGTCVRSTRQWSEHSLSVQMSINGFVENAYAYSSTSGEVDIPVYESPPRLRVVCSSRAPTTEADKEIFNGCISSTHELGPQATTHPVKFLRIILRSYLQAGCTTSFGGYEEDFLECQQLMIDDVRQSSGQRLDPWQRNHIIACLRTELRHMWCISEHHERGRLLKGWERIRLYTSNSITGRRHRASWVFHPVRHDATVAGASLGADLRATE